MSKKSKAREESWIDRCLPFLPKDPTHPVQIALRTYALALLLSLGPSLSPFIVVVFSKLINIKTKRSSTKTDLATLKRVLRRELGHDGLAFSMTLSVAGGAAIRDLLLNTDTSTDKEICDSNGSRIGAARASSSRGVQRLLQLFKSYLLSAFCSPEQQTFISHFLSSFIGILLLKSGRARTARLQAASKVTKPNGHAPTLDLTLILLVRAVDSIVQTFILQKSQPIAGYINNASGPGYQPVSLEDSSSRSAVHQPLAPEAHLVHDKLVKEKSKKETHKIKLKLTSRLDAFVFWACSARYVFGINFPFAHTRPLITIYINRIMWCFFYEPHRYAQKVSPLNLAPIAWI